jgi:sugar lactone lactonase YvrE
MALYDTMWGEALRVHDGTVWTSDTQAGELVSIDSSGAKRRPLASPTNGLWFLPDGRLAAARWRDRRVDVLVDGEFQPYADLSDLVRDTLGDMTGTDDGRLYVDDMGVNPHSGEAVGRILAIDPDGSARVAADGLRFPNGLAVVGDLLIVAETHAARLTAFDIVDGGRLENRRTWADLADLLDRRHRPDGIWPVGDGSVWVAATTAETFIRVRGNEVVDRVPTPGEFAISCCLDGTSLYISATHSTQPGLSLLTEALPQKKIRGRIDRVDVSP